MHPALDVIAGHKCPICLGLVCVFCGVLDPNADLHSNVTCAGLAKKKTKDTRKAPPNNEKKAPAKKAKAPTKKAKTHPQAAELAPTKLKKTPAAKALRLAATSRRQDPLIMRSVCFLANDGEDGTKLATCFGGVDKIEKSLRSIDGKL